MWSVRGKYVMSEKILRFTLILLFFIPPLVFVPGRFNGQWIFVNYREPKLAAVQILSWLFLTIFWWTVWQSPERIERLKRVLKDRFTWFFLFFFLYLCWTARGTLVIEAAFYELAQYFTIINIYIALSVLWQEENLLTLSLVSLISAFVIVTAIGLYQLWKPIPFLIPIGHQALNPSTLGYKNPAAQAVLGQIFLLLALVARAADSRKWMLTAAGIVQFLIEAFYLSTLQSRTSYFSFAVTLVFVTVMGLIFLVKNKRHDMLKVALPVLILVSAIFAGTLAKYPPAHKRFEKMVIYFKDPAKFLDSDRGIYLRNSIYMAEKNFFGVGIGNWGFAYPVYRHYKPHFLYNKRIQVRRAHGDYAQMLGETGWPGLAMFVFLAGWVFKRGLTTIFFSNSLSLIFITAQLLVFLCIMLFDYCIEMPYHKFVFFAVIAMVNVSWLSPPDSYIRHNNR